ncbi:MAG: alpha/beta hydrolase [Pseudomonadota bacterium]
MSLPLGFPKARPVQAGDVTFSVHEAGPEDGLPVLLVHGWPELAFSWAPIVEALTGAGCRLIMPDQKGFGASSKPEDLSEYSMTALTADYDRLLAAMGIEKAVVVGHDWGGALIWPLAQRYPERCLGVASLCTPYPPLAPAPPLKIYRRKMGEAFYIVQFQDEDLPDRVFGGKEELFFPFIFRPGPPRSRWADLMPGVMALPDRFTEAKGPYTDVIRPPEALSVYVEAYRRSGHKTPTMVYRQIDTHWEERSAFNPQITMPALMITAERDLMLPRELSEGMEERIPNLSRAHVDSGHWMMWEAPDEASAALIRWMKESGFLTSSG